MFEDLQQVYEFNFEFIMFVILNINFLGVESGEVLNYFVDFSVLIIVFMVMFQDSICEGLLVKEVVDYIIKDSVFVIDMLVELVCWFFINQCYYVLIVDDSVIVCVLLMSCLKCYNFCVSLVENGIVVIEMLKKNLDISFVIIDYNMFDIDGFELIWCICYVCGLYQLCVIGVLFFNDCFLLVCFFKVGGNDFMMWFFIDEEFYCCVNQNFDMLVQIKFVQEWMKVC